METGRKSQWTGNGWRRPAIGRAKIRRAVTPYGGQWHDVVEIRGGDVVLLWIYPGERLYYRYELDRIDIESGVAA